MQTEKGDHQNVARAAMVIDVLARAHDHGLRQTDVIERTGLGPATIHRLLTGLAAYGFVDHDKESNRYFVGLKMVSWTAAAMERYGLAPFVDPSLERLCTLTEDTVYFSLISGFDSVCVDRREGSYPIKTLTLALGDRRPLGVGAGSLALLSFQSPKFIDNILREDEARRIPLRFDSTFLRGEVERTRAEGHALNAGRLIEGMSGVAVPIRKSDGSAVAAVSIAAITSRISGERLATIVAALKKEVASIEAAAHDVLNTPLARRQSVSRKA